MLDEALEANPREMIGGNNPPELTPFERSLDEINGLYIEAKNWLDKPVTSDAEEQAVARLIEMLRKAIRTADERRAEEKKPLDEQVKAIQDKYNDLIGDTKSKKGIAVRALEAAKAALAPWLTEKDRKQREEAERLRKEAEEKERAAREAMQAAHRYDLDAREQAEAQAQEAKEAEKAAARAENQKANAKGGTRAIGLRTIYEPEITNTTEFARYLWVNNATEYRAFLDEMAAKLVQRGVRSETVPGLKVHERKVV